jgi:hypothetical protein
MASRQSELCSTATTQELMSKIAEVLRESPPLRPSSAAVDLLLAVSRLQVRTLTAGMQRQLSEALHLPDVIVLHPAAEPCVSAFPMARLWVECLTPVRHDVQCAGLSGDVRRSAGPWHARLPKWPRPLLAPHCALD